MNTSKRTKKEPPIQTRGGEMLKLCEFCEQRSATEEVVVDLRPDGSPAVRLYSGVMCSACSYVYRSFIAETIRGKKGKRDWGAFYFDRVPPDLTLYFVGFAPLFDPQATIEDPDPLDDLLQRIRQTATTEDPGDLRRIAAAMNAAAAAAEQGAYKRGKKQKVNTANI